MLHTLKDLCRETQLHDRTLRRWLKRLGPEAQPDACGRNGCYRWTDAGKEKFLTLWRNYNQSAGRDASMTADLFTGKLRDRNQNFLDFNGNSNYKIKTGEIFGTAATSRRRKARH